MKVNITCVSLSSRETEKRKGELRTISSKSTLFKEKMKNKYSVY